MFYSDGNSIVKVLLSGRISHKPVDIGQVA